MAEPGKEPLPQTVEALQECMARDAEIMLQMREEIGRLKHKLNQERQRRKKAEARASIPSQGMTVPVMGQGEGAWP